MSNGSHEEREVDALSPESTGRWLVTTQGSQHIWDLDAMTYRRLPGDASGMFSHDDRVVRITRVERWPAVGGTSFLWFDDPEHPAFVEHWRQSSRIEKIERLDEGSEPEST